MGGIAAGIAAAGAEVVSGLLASPEGRPPCSRTIDLTPGDEEEKLLYGIVRAYAPEADLYCISRAAHTPICGERELTAIWVTQKPNLQIIFLLRRSRCCRCCVHSCGS